MFKNVIKEVIWVGFGGMIGALLRYGTNTLFTSTFGNASFITATTVENITGSFLIGVIFSFLSRKKSPNRMLNLFLLTGLIGSYTTYSGFMVEAFVLLHQSPLLFLGYLCSQIFMGLLAVTIGMRMFKQNRVQQA
ncbi:MAG: CrcB family protein [Balneolaceae bacterium]